MQSDIERVLFDAAAIYKRLNEMAARITADYPERELTVIAILTGSLMFMSDLQRRIPLPLKLDCLSVVSYHGQAQTSGEVIFKQLAVPDVAGWDILILDDILDTGHTLAAVRKKLERCNEMRSMRPGFQTSLMIAGKYLFLISEIVRFAQNDIYETKLYGNRANERASAFLCAVA